MTRAAAFLTICVAVVTGNAPAATGPAGATGACSHVMGPVDSAGNPIGFTCTDVGGTALLVWNASQLGANITVSGGVSSLNFFPKSFLFDRSLVSNGPVALVGNRTIKITGSITGTSVLIASLTASENDLKTSLLDPATGRITSTSTFPVEVALGGKVQSTNGNLVVSASTVTNRGSLVAKNGTLMLTTGSKLDVGWDNVSWVEGVHTDSTNHSVTNLGEIRAANVIMEAHRGNTTSTSIFNSGKISSTGTVTFVTAHPGSVDGLGNYAPGSFGISNTTGKIYAANVVVSPYSQAVPGGSATNRTFNMTDAAQKKQLQRDLGGQFYDPTQDNTPTTAAAPVIDAGNTFTVTSNIVVPQLTPSMSHLNATTSTAAPALVMAKAGAEQMRGENAKPAAPKPKPRSKAKPVLVRGIFFDSKISAVLTPPP